VHDPQKSQQKQIEHLMMMLEITRILSSTLDVERLEEIIVQSATRLVECEDCSILLIDPQSGELSFEASAGLAAEKTQPIVVPMDGSIAGWIVRHNDHVIISDVQKDPRFFKQSDQSTGFDTRSLLGVPVSFKGRPIGVLEAVNKRDGEFEAEDAEELSVLAAQAAVAIENARLLGELQRAYEELNELDRLKSEFITTTSHELRTPLTSIKGYLQLITSGMVPPDLQNEMLNTVSSHVDTVVHLVNDLLLMQEMDAVEFHKQNVDVADIVRAEMAATRPYAESSGIHWAADVAPDLPPVWADAEHLQRMFHNLLDNAIKFSPDGGDVTVRAYAEGDKVCVQVIDSGVGIPPEEQERVFERFYRIEKAGDHLFGGLGLGLAIAKYIVEKHDGQIQVVSAPGKGSTFTVALPKASRSA
jgi:sigma-B regulation protein RsbU (phosphoserine phosphatase)